MSGPATGVFLLEIGTEEIPARMIDAALRDLRQALSEAISAGGLAPGAGGSLAERMQVFGTPRRLAVRAHGLLARQADARQEIAGPRVEAAFDARGRPTKAAEGFARAQGVPADALRRVATPRGECVGVVRQVRGREAAEVLAEKVPGAVLSIAFPKTMRWGAGEHRFVRPIHWVVALFDDAVVDLTIAGVRSGNRTLGHRRLGATWITLRDPLAYEAVLRERLVEADIGARRRAIQERLAEASREAGAVLAAPPGAPPGSDGDPDLLDEIVHTVEWPLVFEGTFDEAFLGLPQEILVTAMRHHQKYFSLRRPSGGLLNRFLAVADARDDEKGLIRKGNEWVLRARLADARFFWEEDRRTPLGRHAGSLARVTFHERLGTYARKIERMRILAGALLEAFARSGVEASREAVDEAVGLCKADLTTQMVKEFPELEGIVGGLYARADGLPEAIAAAIYAHYMPRGADEAPPPTPEGAVVSLADRLDTQAGIFLLGVVPTGSRDPYGLRRSALGACRILIDRKVRVSLVDLIGRALAGYRAATVQGGVPEAGARSALLEFYRGRLQHLGEEAGLRQDSVRAALAARADDPHDARLRMAALDAIREETGFEALALAHKRIKNILKDQGPPPFAPDLLQEGAERALERALRAAEPSIETAQARADHLQALREIARLGPLLDRFFQEVMVMVDDRRVRDNRLGLLQAIAGLFLRVGDFSEIVAEGEPAAPARRARAAARPPEAGR